MPARLTAGAPSAPGLPTQLGVLQFGVQLWRQRPVPVGARPDWMEPFARTIDAAKKYVVSSTLMVIFDKRSSISLGFDFNRQSSIFADTEYQAVVTPQ
jgi:hypothetical protein